VGTDKKALHSQKRDSDLWVRQKWPIWSQKIELKENGEENDIRKIQRKTRR
jgi:hypothetical protein